MHAHTDAQVTKSDPLWSLTEQQTVRLLLFCVEPKNDRSEQALDMSADSLIPDSFDQLAISRKAWIETVLRPWCQQMPLQELRKAEKEWLDIAGKVDPAATLWTWAWERFPALVHPDLPGVNETHQVAITLTDGSNIIGFPDNRQSVRGSLVLVDYQSGALQTFGPFSIDQIRTAELT